MLNAQHLKIDATPHINDINRSIYSLQGTSKSRLQLFIAVFLICFKKVKMMEPAKKHAMIYGPGLRFVSVLHENGIVSDRYYNNSRRVSNRHEVRPL